MALPCNPAVFDRVNIDHYASRFGLTQLADEQFEFVRNAETIDVQAAPGSGKTTLTALKLCLLASGWLDPKGGICILSHTKTAKNQIIDLLGQGGAGQRLTQYPHFIGTIQAFIDQFLALPYLRAAGIEISIIDDDLYAEAALQSLQRNPRYRSLRGYLGQKQNRDTLVGSACYRFQQGELVVEPGEGSLKCGPHTDSAKQYNELKNALRDRGLFRYDDMYAFALKYLANANTLQSAFARRFPMVLIDEMQDTNSLQEEVLSNVFQNPSVTIQRIGDVNQRIFDRETNLGKGSSFPKPDALELRASMRFGPNIARVASALTVLRPQGIETPDDQKDSVLTAILYDAHTVGLVIPKFAEIVADTVSAEQMVKYPVRALGARRESGSTKPFPGGITTYTPGLASRNVKPRRAERLIHFVAEAQVAQRANGNTQAAVPRMWEGIVDLLRRWGVQLDDGRSATVSRLKQYLDRQPREESLRVRRGIVRLLACDLNDKTAWSRSCSELIEGLAPLAAGKLLTKAAMGFVSLDQDGDIASASIVAESDSKLRNANGLSLVACDTIHNAKGETHSATLILECPDHQIYDLQEALPLICGKANPKRVQQNTVKDSVQRIFVAATRPRWLLAIAMLKEHALPFIADLKAGGWNVVDLADPQTTRENPTVAQ